MASGSNNGGRKRRKHEGIPRDDPRRQALRDMGFMQDGYIEGLPTEPEQPTDFESAGEAFQPMEAGGQDDFQGEFQGNLQPDFQPGFQDEQDPSDTGSLLGGGDVDWATDLIGDVPDHVENDDLIAIGGHGGYQSQFDEQLGDQYEDQFAGQYDAPITDPFAGSYNDPDGLDVTAMSQEQPMTEPPAFSPDYPGNGMPPLTDNQTALNEMGNNMDYQPTAPAPAPASMPAPAPAPTPAPAPLPEEREYHESPRRERRPGRLLRLVKRILLLILLIAVFAGGFALGLMYEQNQHPSVSAAFIETQLSECNDLATAKMHYNGLVHYESGDIPLINKKSFSMTYQAEVRAGIDLSKADVQVSNGTITITLPKATIQTTTIDPTSVKFFDQTWGLFSWESKDDAKTALEQAQNDLNENIDDMMLIEEANLNAQQTVRGLVAPILKMNDGYKLEIRTQP